MIICLHIISEKIGAVKIQLRLTIHSPNINKAYYRHE